MSVEHSCGVVGDGSLPSSYTTSSWARVRIIFTCSTMSDRLEN